MSHTRLTSIATLAVVALSLQFYGCGDDDTTTPPPPGPIPDLHAYGQARLK